MSSLRIIRRRIRSVENTKKITRAMQMVAGAKLRRLQEDLASFRPYATYLADITKRFLENHPDCTHSLLESPAPESPVGLLLITSDTGLCGTYNERILAMAHGFLREHPSAVIVAIGKKGSRFLARRGITRAKELLDWGGRYDPSQGEELFAWMRNLYEKGDISSWWIAHTQFVSAMQWKPTVSRLVPLSRPAAKELPQKVILEPDKESLSRELLERYSVSLFTEIMLSSFTAEHSARMISMKNATDNAAEMIDSLTLVRNKVRQAAITKELIEVVSSAEALT